MFCRVPLALGCLALLALPNVSLAHDRKIQTNRPTRKLLPLPTEEGVFHFVIFGDRTGGPAEGIRVLEQAVVDTNLLDPDLVMTVGDLIQGYNQTPEWLIQANEFIGVMEELRMPWFPVAGNHDIYWRGPGRPPGEHEKSYERHFGPLWYWFEHKQSGFVVLYSDEGDPETGEKDYHKGSSSQLSPAQLAWLERSLEKMRELEHVFVFLHHPRWITGRYPDNNWPRVHEALVAAGNVRAVFAGHIHRLHYGGKKDGIEYFSLATTGGSIPGDYPHMGYLHHLHIVTVRPDDYSVATVPVGAVIDPRKFTDEYLGDVDRARGIAPRRISGPVRIGLDGEAAGFYELAVANSSKRPIEVTLTVDGGDPSWRLTPDHRHVRVDPADEATLEFAYAREGGSFDGALSLPRLLVETDYLAADHRVSLPRRSHSLAAGLREVPEEFFAAATKNRALRLGGGRDCVRVESGDVDLGDGAFTLEAWARPAKLPDTTGVIAKTENSEFAIFMNDGRPEFSVFLGSAYVNARAEKALPVDAWSHLAGVFDGEELRLYVDGALAARAAGSGKRKRNNLPLFLGADTDGRGNATRPFVGQLDEVRLSRVARYAGERFGPVSRHAPDGDTVLLFHLDRAVGPFVVDHSARRVTAKIEGKAALVERE